MEHPAEHPALRSGGTRPLGARASRQLLLFLGVYVLYVSGRWLFAGHVSVAREHARWVVHLERALHAAIEGSVQRGLDSAAVSSVLSNVYLAAQLAVLPWALIWLYRRASDIYRQLRNTVIAAWLISVPIFAMLPVAPPRLAGIGISDTVSQQAAVALTGQSTLFYNPYAAVPSLHVGFAFAIGIAAAGALRTRRARVLALSWGPLVCVSVIATGNHYLFDVAAGLLVTALAFAAVKPRGPLALPATRSCLS